LSGTSAAAAHVAGAFAVAKQVIPAATVAQIETALNETGKPITDTLANPQITRDRIRVFSAAANLRHTGFRWAVDLGPFPDGAIASDGVGLARRTNADPNPTTPSVSAAFMLTGIPMGARVRAAYIVYQTVGGPDPSFTFKGTSRTAALIGGSGQFTCWNTNNGGAFRTYLYRVPAGQVTGNGSYSIGGIGGASHPLFGTPDGQGASMPGSPDGGRVFLRVGSMTARPGGAAMAYVFRNLTVPVSVFDRAMHVGIGDGEMFSDPPMRFNAVNTTGSNFWSGRDGTYWDDDRINVSGFAMPTGTANRGVAQAAQGECLTWSYAALTFKQ
jgi:hypothetical protein